MSEDFRLEALIGDVLLAKGWTVCTAESCTGGLIAHRLTNIPGCSAYVLGGIVSYSNAVKMKFLSVPESILNTHGAVSEATARAMADGARTIFDADIGVSVTGIAGPGGATPGKPVGLVYIGLAVRGRDTVINRYVWENDRESNKARSADAALQMLYDAIKL